MATSSSRPSARKPAANRKTTTARKSTASSTTSTQPKTPVEQVQQIANQVVLVPLGASLLAPTYPPGARGERRNRERFAGLIASPANEAPSPPSTAGASQDVAPRRSLNGPGPCNRPQRELLCRVTRSQHLMSISLPTYSA